MLEAGEQPIESINHEVGKEDAAFLVRLFKRNSSLSPALYRKRFGVLHQSLATGAA